MEAKKFKIEASTNGYIANRDAIFKGKTRVTLRDNLTYSEARELLISFCISDYESTNVVEHLKTFEDYLRFYFHGLTEEMADNTGMKAEEYFETHKKTLKILYEKKHDKLFEKFEGSGYYGYGDMPASALLLDTCNSYEYDSRFFRIIEEETEV